MSQIYLLKTIKDLKVFQNKSPKTESAIIQPHNLSNQSKLEIGTNVQQ